MFKANRWRPGWRFAAQIFMGYFFLVGVAMFFILDTFMSELRPGVRQAIEDSLVNSANLLAEVVAEEMASEEIASEEMQAVNGNGLSLEKSHFAQAMSRYSLRQLNAQISFLKKSTPDLRVYITDHKGIVVFDSSGQYVGQNFSLWNDVYLTLKGEYGARTTNMDTSDPNSSEMYVAAPIYAINNRNDINNEKHGSREGEPILLGVLTVIKPIHSVLPFVDQAEKNLRVKSLILLGFSLLVGMFLAWLLTRSVRQLEHFTHRVRQGYRDPVPNIKKGEFSRLALAIGEMRDELEGKAYVENYIQTLTHELKSPITSIQGASEIIQELAEDLKDNDVDEHQQLNRFASNIHKDSHRLRRLVDQMLQLSALEKTRAIQDPTWVDVVALVREEKDNLQFLLEQRHLDLNIQYDELCFVMGDTFLVQLAISNLLTNAVRYSKSREEISVRLENKNKEVCIIHVENTGPRIPDYALGRIFERFYSLEGPDQQEKSSGLGLSIVKEIAELHHGDIKISNTDRGVCAVLRLSIYH